MNKWLVLALGFCALCFAYMMMLLISDGTRLGKWMLYGRGSSIPLPLAWIVLWTWWLITYGVLT